MILLALFFFLTGLILLWRSIHQQKASGLPSGRVIYADMGKWRKVEEALYDPSLHLTGRPDYLVQQANDIIPVEVKSSPVTEAPYDSHIYQLAAYCLLVKSIYNLRPPYGILHYPNHTFAIDFTEDLEESTLALLKEMQTQDASRELKRSHNTAARCAACGYRQHCNQAI